MLRNKLKITISFILLTLFCGVSVFSQENSIDIEELKTEFIKLRNVPSCPNGKNACNGFRIGYFKLVDSLKIYLTKRGAIEFVSRSKLIIITDTEENVSFFKRTIDAFDYPEMYKISEADFQD